MADGNNVIRYDYPQTPEPFYRNTFDMRLMGIRQTPEAQYPDGYLGSFQSRQSRDNFLRKLSKRATEVPYARGVHKGERIEPIDYQWTPEVNMRSGVINQARGRRWAPAGKPVELIPRAGIPLMEIIDPKRAKLIEDKRINSPYSV